MTLNLKITHAGGTDYKAVVKRDGAVQAELHHGETADVSLWQGTSLEVTEAPADKKPDEAKAETDSNAAGTEGTAQAENQAAEGVSEK